ncbi:hypothetical protein ENUP19_0083G0094 [Entamoeba nuttalli]|uniref:HEAT repeat domain containing protein n=2 Tax=Entamoeba nuttalli TaxID=412467 RepID=K2GTM2_ENTNP|nr:HEAT repeat domain containing protein [Entamoeba nuttalli P19]EKE38408.1 HEAT repeat domain containing protein [Entamoeba nuttalli P19]|eukprot:XP_008859256.1 HEAT repeat domain containing protein [Entamoeba nuttalli P19]
MNFFKNIFSDPSQVTKAVIGDPFETKSQIQTINNSTIQCEVSQSVRKIDRTKGTTFTYETNFYKSNKQQNYPQLLIKKLKNLNCPALPKIYETNESGSKVTIITEEMYPISNKINDIRKSPDLLIWAVYNLVRGVDYLHTKGYLHGNIKPTSLYVTKALEVKIFGLEYLSEFSSLNNSPFENRIQTDPQILDEVYLPPDPNNYKQNAQGVDSWGVAGVLCYLFGTPITKKSMVAQAPSIPVELSAFHKSIDSVNHVDRQSVASLLTIPFITQNRFIAIINTLEHFSTVDAFVRDSFLRSLATQFDTFPPSFRQYKLLESFLEIMKIGKNESVTVVEPTMRLTTNISQEDFDSDVLPTIKLLLQNGTPIIKSALLAHASLYVNKLSENIVGNYLYPMLSKSMAPEATGSMKDAAVRSLVCLAPKLPQSTLNGEVFRFLDAALQDPESVVRINTVVCIGKIANRFNDDKKAKLVASAFSRSMKDGVADMKKAAVIMVSQNKYAIDGAVCAKEVIPYLSQALLDLDPQVRKAAIECWDVIAIIVREYAMTLDNPSYVPKYPKEGDNISLGISNQSTNQIPIFSGQSTSFTPQSAVPQQPAQSNVTPSQTTATPTQKENNTQPKQPTQQNKPSQPKPTVQADDWDSWAASFEKQTKSKQPQIAYGGYTSTPINQPKPATKPKPAPKKSNNDWGFDFDSDIGGGNSGVPSFI